MRHSLSEQSTGWIRQPGKLARAIIVLAGIILGQAVLYGPSLAGRKILLPLDILAEPAIYLPRTPELAQLECKNPTLSDQVYLAEPTRRFAASEIHAGRLPMWLPSGFCGAPFIGAKFSPFLALEYCTASPVILAWAQLLEAVVAGLGAYAFFRRGSGLSFWPAAICGWCYPLTGFFILWEGGSTSLPVSWLPWLLLAVERAMGNVESGKPEDDAARGRESAGGTGALPQVGAGLPERKSGGLRRCAAPVGVSVVTGLVLVSGQLDVGGQVLLMSGLYAVWRLVQRQGRALFAKSARRIAVKLACGWALGFLLAAPYLLPLLEYSSTGDRMARRKAGQEERPPAGLAALPQVVLPDLYGRTGAGKVRIIFGPQSESSAAGYAGVLATLLVAPLAFCRRNRLGSNLKWVCLGLLGMSWCLNLPGLVHVLRLPGLSMLSHNRLVFITAFAVLALVAEGLEALRQGEARWWGWMWLPLATLAGLCLWNTYRIRNLPEPVKSQIATRVAEGKPTGALRNQADVKRAQAWFTEAYSLGAVWCGLGVLGWVLLRRQPGWQSRLVPGLAAVMMGELLAFGYDRFPQSDPSLYYPQLPVLQAVAGASPVRIVGYGCFPPNLPAMCGLNDVRGYDAVDPEPSVTLVMSATSSESPLVEYSRTLFVQPRVTVNGEGKVQLAPALDLLGTRYVIFRGGLPPRAQTAFRGNDYYVLENPAALPRAFVPARVETVASEAAVLTNVASAQFKPSEVAYVAAPVSLPAACRGSVALTEDIPTCVRLSLHMDTAGLVVLTDSWNKGWRALLDGKPAPILRTDYAVRGVVVPAGASTLEFRYQPSSFVRGLWLCGAGAAALLSWVWFGNRRARVECK